MKLLVFAHRTEAQAFLSQFPFKKQDHLRSDYFICEKRNLSLLITGEGIDESSKHMTYLLSYLEAQQSMPEIVINMGIAGSLLEKLELLKVYSVRTGYRFFEETPLFKSFTTHDKQASLDCISTNQRVIEKNYAHKLKIHGDLVDRELWGIAQACQFFNIPLFSYKLVSDYAGETQCEIISDQGNDYSYQLYQYFIDLDQQEIQATQSTVLTPKLESFLNQISPTFSQRVQLEKLLDACIKRELDFSIIFESEIYQDWPRKKRNQYIISKLTEIADPIQAKLTQLCQDFSTLHCKAITHTEDPTIELKARIHNEQQRQDLIKEIQNLPLDKLKNFYQGLF